MTVSSSVPKRVDRLRALMAKAGLGALVVFAPANCRYLTGFTGEAASVIVTEEDVVIVTDARFTVQAEVEVPRTRVILAVGSRDEPVRDFLTEARYGDGAAGVVGIDSGHLTVKRWEPLRELLDECSVEWRLVDGLVEDTRCIKFPDELVALRAAGSLAASAFTYLESLPVIGRREREVALDLEMFLRQHGSEGVPFPFIVAAGHRGAMPHGEASAAVIEAGQLVVFDIGAVVDGYASDITRTYATGPLDDDLLEAYATVRAGQTAAVAAVRAGISCRELDEIARAHIRDAGLGELFVHSLGHGVGLEVHEGPTISPRSDDVLQAGMVLTVEPGVYIPGRGGVRIEDSVVVTSTGVEVLTECPRDLRTLT
ncbi:MAG: M24 family metallopeptidase [Thermoleophilia bacterium]|jgi:Xaa-Pro aminopeptidase